MHHDPVLVVLDDDPTGTQTVHDVSVLTSWQQSDLEEQFQRNEGIFYILTNSRSVSEPESVIIAQQIGTVLAQAARKAKKPFIIISRSDSTLRGHFPAEVIAVANAAAVINPLIVLAPAFIEGGRITEGDVHYLLEEGRRIPVSQTVFAHDPAFGYRNANLREWVKEKSGNSIGDTDIVSLSIDDIRHQLTAELSAQIGRQKAAKVLIVNALTYDDLVKVADVLKQLRHVGREIIVRSGASLVRTMAGIQPQPLLTGRELKSPGISTGGLIIVGSFVPKTTEQLQYVQTHLNLPTIEVSIQAAQIGSSAYIQSIGAEVEQHLRAGKTIIIQSARQLVAGNSIEESLKISQQVSGTLVQIVQNLTVIPAFILAKGGITSSDIATKGMGIRRATVKGQILAGIPVWEPESSNRFSGIPYIVFPGNVGNAAALYEVVNQFM